MKNLITLVKMQLKEKMNLKRRKLDGSGIFDLAVAIFAEVLKFALVTAFCTAIILALAFLVFGSDVPMTVMSIVFTAMLILSVFSCTVGLTKAMYFSRDNSVLLTLPCKPIQVYLSKLVIFFFFELKKNFAFIVPLFIGYFIASGYAWYFYPWLLVCYVFISMLTVSIGAILSVPAMWVSSVFRQRAWLRAFVAVACAGAAALALFYGISLIPTHLDLRSDWPNMMWNIRNSLSVYATKFSVLYDLTRLMLGELSGFELTLPFARTLLRFAVLLCATLVTFFLGILLVKPLFYTMASKPFEYLKKQVKPKKNKRISSKFSAVYNEFLKVFKDSTRMFANAAITVSIPILVFFLNKVFYAMNTKEFGDYMVIAFNLLIILLVALNANTYAASIYSRDGRSAYLIKVQPTNPKFLLVAKLLPNTLFCVVSFVITFFILLISTNLPLIDALLMMIAVLFIYLAHLLFCAQKDIMNPQTEIYASMGEHENDPNEAVATVTAFLIAFTVAGATLMLLSERGGGVYIKLALVGLALFAYEVWMFFSKIKLYYKEK